MDYKKQLAVWRKRRKKVAALLAVGMPRKEIARRLGITRQRLSQLERVV